MPRTKSPTAFRLADDAREMLPRLADYHGRNMTNMMETLIREAFARDEEAILKREAKKAAGEGQAKKRGGKKT
jgi:hypothetical protein